MAKASRLVHLLAYDGRCYDLDAVVDDLNKTLRDGGHLSIGQVQDIRTIIETLQGGYQSVDLVYSIQNSGGGAMSKHTPGPWAVQRERYVVATSARAFIATVNVPCIIPSEVASANARLIAAAPDLLEALRKIAECRHYSVDEGENMQWAIEGFRADAIAAIAKATQGED